MLSPAGVKEHWLVKMYPSNNTRIHPIIQTKYVHRITDMPRPDVRNGDGGSYDTEARRSTSTRDSGKTSPGHLNKCSPVWAAPAGVGRHEGATETPHEASKVGEEKARSTIHSAKNSPGEEATGRRPREAVLSVPPSTRSEGGPTLNPLQNSSIHPSIHSIHPPNYHGHFSVHANTTRDF